MVLKAVGPIPSALKELMSAYRVDLVADSVFVKESPHFLWLNNKLVFCRDGGAPQVDIDFEKDFKDYQRQRVSPKKHLLARALGLDKTPGVTIVDGTLGMGKDAFLLACLGARVVGVERDPIPSLLVSWAIHSFQLQYENVINMEVQCQQTADFLAGLVEPIPTTLYLDPMFENLKGAALPKKSMAFLRERQLGRPSDFQEVFKLARTRGFKRIVVKRPRKGDHLFGSPSYEICGKMIRYDVYFYSED